MTVEEGLREYMENDRKDTIGFYEAYKNVCFFRRVRKVIYHDPATIVFWNDGTKTVVKCAKDDVYNPVTGLAVCFVKKFLGPLYFQEFKKNLPKTTEVDVHTENKTGERWRVFADQCDKCAWTSCNGSCSECGAGTEIDAQHKTCACAKLPKPNEDSCKYYKRKER